MNDGQQCIKCNGTICDFCQFNNIVNNGGTTLEDHSEE